MNKPLADAKEHISSDVDTLPGAREHAAGTHAMRRFGEPEEIADAVVYFTIGVPAETGNILPNTSEDLNIVDLVDSVNDVYPDLMFEEDDHEDEHEDEDDHDHSGRDPHIWLSLKRVKVMVTEIKDELVRLDPDNESTYTKNYDAYIAEISTVQEQATALLESKTVRSFIVYHPSWGYFAKRYSLEQVAIESQGKEPKPKELIELIKDAKEHNISLSFLIENYLQKIIAYRCN